MQGQQPSLRQQVYNTTPGFLQGPCPKGPILTVWHRRSGRTGFSLYWDGRWNDSFGQHNLDKLFGIPPRAKETGSQRGYPSEPVIQAVWRYLEKRYNEGDPNVKYSKSEPDLNISRTLTPVAVDITEPPSRLPTEVYRVLRDTKLAREIKLSHGFQCQICQNPPLKLNDTKVDAEVHHIKPLGSPHDGPDVSPNILWCARTVTFSLITGPFCSILMN